MTTSKIYQYKNLSTEELSNYFVNLESFVQEVASKYSKDCEYEFSCIYMNSMFGIEKTEHLDHDTIINMATNYASLIRVEELLYSMLSTIGNETQAYSVIDDIILKSSVTDKHKFISLFDMNVDPSIFSENMYDSSGKTMVKFIEMMKEYCDATYIKFDYIKGHGLLYPLISNTSYMGIDPDSELALVHIIYNNEKSYISCIIIHVDEDILIRFKLASDSSHKLTIDIGKAIEHIDMPLVRKIKNNK